MLTDLQRKYLRAAAGWGRFPEPAHTRTINVLLHEAFIDENRAITPLGREALRLWRLNTGPYPNPKRRGARR